MTHFLNFRKRPTGGGIPESIDEIGVWQVTPGSPPTAVSGSPRDLADAMLGKHIIFATHGFNVSEEDGYAELSNWHTLLQLDPSYLLIGMVWPGDSSWLGPLCYPGEGQHAMKCGDLLAEFIETYGTGAATVSFVSHSLGARFILQAIASLDPSFTVRQVAIMAGAVNDDCLTNEYQSAAARIGKINLLASRKDEVLSLAFPPGNLFEGIIDKGHPYWSGALGRYGPVTPVPGKPIGRFLIPDDWNFGHGNYVSLAPPLDPPLVVQDVPPEGTPVPYAPPPDVKPEPWQPSWTAAFVSTRFK